MKGLKTVTIEAPYKGELTKVDVDLDPRGDTYNYYDSRVSDTGEPCQIGLP